MAHRSGRDRRESGQHSQHEFAVRGGHIPAINLGTPDNQGSRHYGSNVAGTARIVRWFIRLACGR